MENFGIQTQTKTLAYQAYPTKLNAAQVKRNEMADPALANWIKDAEAYLAWYRGVVSGEIKLQPGEKLPSDAAIAQFNQYFQWAIQQVSSSWGSNFESGNGFSSPAPQLPPGAKLGPMNNIVFNGEKAEVTYTPSTMPIDVFSDEFTLNVDVKAQVNVEMTTDTRVIPAAKVFKFTVKDPASTPSTTTYFVNAEAKININTLGGKGVTQHGTESLKLPDGSNQINIGTYTAKEAAGSEEGNTLNGVEDKSSPGTVVYKPEYESDIFYDFKASPGKDETSVIYANANITCKPGDQAEVSLLGEDLKIVVTHDDKTTDTYILKKGYQANININKEYITFGGKKGPIPEAMVQRISLNGDKGKTTLESKEQLPTELQNLMGLIPGLSVEQMLAKLKTAYPALDGDRDGSISLQELKDATTAKSFPPFRPNKELIGLLVELDPQLKDLWEATKRAFNDEASLGTYANLMNQVSERLKNLLNGLYPGRVSFTPVSGSDWRKANNLLFDGQTFEAFSETTNDRGITMAWY